MQIIPMFLLAAATLAAAAYAHLQLVKQTPTSTQRAFLHVLLTGTGAAFGWVVSRGYSAPGFMEILIFLSAFGVVHVPAAAILFIKRKRKES